MDEIPMFFNAPSRKTYDLKAIKTVKVKTTGQEKIRFSLVLTISSNGKKCRSMIIFKNLKKAPRPPKGKKWPANVVVTASKGGSMSQDLMKQWIEEVWQKRLGNYFSNSGQNLLIFDSHRAHITKTILTTLKNSRTKVSIVPGGMTPLIQPLDVSVNRSVKAKWAKKWRDWMEEAANSFKKTKQKSKVGYDDIVEWVHEIINEIDEDLIKNSFSLCGIAHSHDGITLHSKLNDIMMTGQTAQDPCEPTGVTDDEDEEIQDDLGVVFEDDDDYI